MLETERSMELEDNGESLQSEPQTMSRSELIANCCKYLADCRYDKLIDLLAQFSRPNEYIPLINVGWSNLIRQNPYIKETDVDAKLLKFFSIKNICNDPDVYIKFLIILRTCMKRKYRRFEQEIIEKPTEVGLTSGTKRRRYYRESGEQPMKRVRSFEESEESSSMSAETETETLSASGGGKEEDIEMVTDKETESVSDEYENSESIIMKHAIKSGNSGMIHCIHKYLGSKITYDKNKFDQHIIDNNYIHHIMIDNKLPNKKIFNVLFNKKIINLKWIGKRNGNIELEEFSNKFQKVLQCIIEMFQKKDSEKIKNAINMDLIKIIHISIFDMFDSCDKEVLKNIVKYKCLEFLLMMKLPDKTTVSVSKLHDEWYAERREDIHNIFHLYSNIYENNLKGSIKYMDLCSEITNYDWTENDFLPIYIAIQQNACEIIQKLMYRRNVNTNLTDYQNSTILHWAMKCPKLFETIKECIEGCTYYNNNVNVKNDLSRKPLYYAIKYNNYDAFEYCTQIRPRKRKLNDELDIFEKSYFVLAAKYGHFDIFNELRTFIEPNETYLYTLRSICVTGYFSLFSIAVDRRQIKFCIQLLKSNPAISNEKFVLGITPLAIAALNGDPDLMLKLLANDANINANIQNDIYIGNIDEKMQQKYIEQGKSKDATLFDSNRFNDNLFEFVCSSFSENKQHNLSGNELSVMKIFVSQLILHGKDMQLPDTMNKDDISILMKHKTICTEELNENGEDMILDLYTVRDFLKCTLSENKMKIKSLPKERILDLLFELKHKIGKLNAYESLGLEKIPFLFKEY